MDGSRLYNGHIELILGPMFSGKSTELLRRMRRFQVSRMRCLVVKYKHDTRYSEGEMATHDRQTIPAQPCLRLADVTDEDEYDCIGIDEGQFFPDLVDWVENQANKGKSVIVAALDATFQRKPFGAVLDLVPLAEAVTKLTAVCMQCHQPASFSKRISSETTVELIGGAEKYISVCRNCYFDNQLPTFNTTPPGRSPVARVTPSSFS
eukprot:TRINITY_DN15868_c0_g1_i1.p1 TRINITY_DN15868_c0_g1~~TRINITY_DN15868_c0_g1_i1.p1  ORF type:complete len:216 (+),score=2.11 TRINITY_DN15868_c0_g1_i1:28-648(+)